MSLNLEEIQLKIERSAIEEGRRQWLDSQRVNPEDTTKSFSDTLVGRNLLHRGINQLAALIDMYRSGEPGRRLTAGVKLMFHLVPDLKDIAFIAMSMTLNEAFNNTIDDKYRDLTRLCRTIGSAIQDHINFLMWKTDNVNEYYYFIRTVVKSHKIREKLCKFMMKRDLQEKRIDLEEELLAAMGAFLVTTIVTDLGLVYIHEDQYQRGLSRRILLPDPKVISYVKDANISIGDYRANYYPMVCPPRPWQSTTNGGYLLNNGSKGGLRIRFIKSSKEHNLVAENHGLSRKFAAADYLGQVPWCINRDMLQIVDKLIGTNHPLMPPTPDSVTSRIPPKPWSTAAEKAALSREVIREWRWKARKVYEDVMTNAAKSSRIRILKIHQVAMKFVSFDKIYFPHNIDFRGRYYPIPRWLNPQGDDFAKSLLMFGEDTPIEQGESARWFKIHGANLYGLDKEPFEKRVMWVDQNHTRIIQLAENPLDIDWWIDADSPWQFLAWALEYRKVANGAKTTRLPVDLDGSCNGLQHLSAVLRDSVGCRSVNLCATDKPQDVYKEVALVVEQLLPPDSVWKGKVTRKVVKRNVMTTPYGVSRWGMRDQLHKELPGVVDGLDKSWKKTSAELVEYIDKAIRIVLSKAKELMDWYQDISTVILGNNQRVTWVTPDGLLVIQDYRKTDTKRIEFICGTQKINLFLTTEDRNPMAQNVKKNVNAFSPNITHSLDASHMTLAIEALKKQGIRLFKGVHDSFGVPPFYVASLSEILRESLVDLYNNFDPIQELSRKVPSDQIPQVPSKGDMNINEVKEAVYAFS